MPESISETIEQVASEGQSATNDGQSATNHSLESLIEADKYLTGKTAVDGTNANGGPKSGWARLRTARAIPPGAV